MLRDDISVLYRHLGRPSQGYLDFQTEDDFRERINRVAARRASLVPSTGSPERKAKVVAVISLGDLYSRKLVASLAGVATQGLKGQVPVHVVDLIPVDHDHEEKNFQISSGIRHVLIDTSKQSVKMEATKEIAWLERQIIADQDDGVFFVDVPESVMHVRHHAMSAADMLLVLVPATHGAVRAIEDIEAELKESQSEGLKYGVHYLLVESTDFECLSPLLQEELMSHHDLFVPVRLQKETMLSSKELLAGAKAKSAEYISLVEICNFILGKFAK